MIEKVVETYLNTALNVPCYIGEKPSTKEDEYVVVSIIDGGRVNYIDAVTLNIFSYSTSLQKAAELNDKVKKAMYSITSKDQISSSKCGGGGQTIDTTTKSYAYECIFNLIYTE